jgi:chemotaxis protein CheD
MSSVREVYLRPGDFCFGEGRLRISTLLGSCVSIVLWHPTGLHGGMCHFMLPDRVGFRGSSAADGKYGDEAMELFMIELGRRRTLPDQYRVHVYGGGNMFGGRILSPTDIGYQNIERAHQLLEKWGFGLDFDHLGSFGHRKVFFDVWSGEVKLVHVDYSNAINK